MPTELEGFINCPKCGSALPLRIVVTNMQVEIYSKEDPKVRAALYGKEPPSYRPEPIA